MKLSCRTSASSGKFCSFFRRALFGPHQREGAECSLFFLPRRVFVLVFRRSQERRPAGCRTVPPSDAPTNPPNEQEWSTLLFAETFGSGASTQGRSAAFY